MLCSLANAAHTAECHAHRNRASNIQCSCIFDQSAQRFKKILRDIEYKFQYCPRINLQVSSMAKWKSYSPHSKIVAVWHALRI